MLAKLPVTLGRLHGRVVHPHPDTTSVVAWGDPAVIFRCGVDRPKALHPGSSVNVFSATGTSGPYYIATDGPKHSTVYTTVDRSVYISIEIPAKYKSGPLPALSTDIAAALPPVCTTNNQVKDISKLCTRRK